MAEKYLKWLMLREIIGEYMDDEYNELHIGDKEYDVKKMKQDYIRLTKELLQDYEIPTPKQDESGERKLWGMQFDGTTTLL